MIISEGIPMTNGEVFALLRRRRDERNAKNQPSFGMQFLSGSAASQPQQQRYASKSGGVSSALNTHTNLYYPPDALLRSCDEKKSNVAPGSSVSLQQYLRNSALLSSPAASHLMVLLTEVGTLRYLSRCSTISGENGIGLFYGPTSVYNKQSHRLNKRKKVKEEIIEGNQGTSPTPYSRPPSPRRIKEEEEDMQKVNEEGNGVTTNTEYDAFMRKLLQYRPGTVGHVEATEALLSLWEQRGRSKEKEKAQKVRCVLRELFNRQRVMGENADEGRVIANEEADAADEQQGSRREEQTRLVFARPATPLAMFLNGMPHAAGDVPAGRFSGGDGTLTSGVGVGVGASPTVLRWTEDDVMRLVMAQPKTSLDVYRIVDDIEQLTANNDELLTFLEESLLKVFA
uniref:Uncharacterized protein n=1 Tax=Trypanosoma congolense (strain IL3000) TaxID=1068625 RepID=G0UK33_TRYCI|nr:conserved hypothetical protein [Trypanosoma congolense IL3000]